VNPRGSSKSNIHGAWLQPVNDIDVCVLAWLFSEKGVHTPATGQPNVNGVGLEQPNDLNYV